jgi:hypothetical protein
VVNPFQVSSKSAVKDRLIKQTSSHHIMMVHMKLSGATCSSSSVASSSVSSKGPEQGVQRGARGGPEGVQRDPRGGQEGGGMSGWETST